jgi:hypothetical protein
VQNTAFNICTSGAEEAIQEIVDSEKKCTGNILELSITK